MELWSGISYIKVDGLSEEAAKLKVTVLRPHPFCMARVRRSKVKLRCFMLYLKILIMSGEKLPVFNAAENNLNFLMTDEVL